MHDMPSDVTGLLAQQDVSIAILGPYMVGLTLNVLLIGVFLALFVSYQKELRSHVVKVKATMWAVLVLVLFCLGVSFEEIIDTAVSQERSSEAMLAGPAQSNVLPVLTGLTGAVCQGFLMVRAAALITSRPLRYTFYAFTTSLILLALASASLFSGIGFLFVVDPNSPSLPLPYSVALSLWLWSSAAADLSITGALAATLRSRIAGFSAKTDGLLNRLIRIALRTAAYTAVISIAGAAVASATEGADFHVASAAFAFYLPLPALHAISLYTTLSSRRVINAELGLSAEPTKGGGHAGEVPFPSARTYRVGGLSLGGGGGREGGGAGQLSERKRDSSRIELDGRGSGGFLPVQIKREEQVEYVDDLDLDEDLVRESRRGRKTRETSIDVV
ncbi:hypothetical protein JCM8547_009143 [Rhodosporidiobolus lusitaniae]